MEIRVLRYFLEAAREGSVTHAAEGLNRGLLDFTEIAQAVDRLHITTTLNLILGDIRFIRIPIPPSAPTG